MVQEEKIEPLLKNSNLVVVDKGEKQSLVVVVVVMDQAWSQLVLVVEVVVGIDKD